jgi:hypothetical protein
MRFFVGVGFNSHRHRRGRAAGGFEPRPYVRSLLLAAVLVGACGDDDDDHGRDGRGMLDGSADSARDAAPSSRDSGRPAANTAVVAEYRAILDDWIVQWDRLARYACDCFVASGAYDSVEGCLALTASGPTWSECASETLAAYDENIDRDDARCVVGQLGDRADCLETVECSDLTPCDEVGRECPMTSNELVTLILQACPDTGLLGRLNP